MRPTGLRASRYRFLRGFAFFLPVSWSRVFTGSASIRRAISSSGIPWSSVCSLRVRALFMVWSLGRGYTQGNHTTDVR